MGGRGASSGISEKGNSYGSQYKTILEHENIKFVTNRVKNYEALMETMTPGRIYVQVGGTNLLRVVQFDGENKRNRVIEFDKRSNKWHAHVGYYHAEHGKEVHEGLNENDKKLIEKISNIWYNKNRKV